MKSEQRTEVCEAQSTASFQKDHLVTQQVQDGSSKYQKEISKKFSFMLVLSPTYVYLLKVMYVHIVLVKSNFQ